MDSYKQHGRSHSRVWKQKSAAEVITDLTKDAESWSSGLDRFLGGYTMQNPGSWEAEA